MIAQKQIFVVLDKLTVPDVAIAQYNPKTASKINGRYISVNQSTKETFYNIRNFYIIRK